MSSKFSTTVAAEVGTEIEVTYTARDVEGLQRAQARDLPTYILVEEYHRRNPPRVWVAALKVAILLDWEWLYLRAWRRTAGDG